MVDTHRSLLQLCSSLCYVFVSVRSMHYHQTYIYIYLQAGDSALSTNLSMPDEGHGGVEGHGGGTNADSPHDKVPEPEAADVSKATEKHNAADVG